MALKYLQTLQIVLIGLQYICVKLSHSFLPYSCTVSHKGEVIHVVFIREGQDLFLMGFPHSR